MGYLSKILASNSPLARRGRWYILRSPAAPWLKSALRAGIRPELRERTRLASTLPVDNRITARAADFNRDGYAIVTDLIDPAALEALAQAATIKLANARERHVAQSEQHKAFWTRLLDEDMVDGALPTDNPYVAFALQQPVLQLVSGIYGELPQLESVLLTLSRDKGGELSFSQLWHRDHDDTRVVKLFVYLTDVDTMADGPFTFLPASVSKRFGHSLRSRRSDAAVDARIRPEEITSLIAPRLSVFMVETSRCLHMGSRMAPGHERLLYTATFISVPRLYPEPPSRFRLTGRESDVVRAVLQS